MPKLRQILDLLTRDELLGLVDRSGLACARTARRALTRPVREYPRP